MNIITSTERREARYQRRKAKRMENLRKRNEQIGTLDEIFTVSNLFAAGKKVCNSVRWKRSTQNFESHLIRHAVDARKAVLIGEYTPKKYNRFVINERGKTREIDAPHITDRMTQRLITTHILLPLYEPSMIYNNCASQKDKGLHMSFQLLKQDLSKHFRKYGMSGYVITIDFKKFFPTASHDVLRERHERLILDDSVRAICDRILETLPYKIGMPLGVEPSQAEMIAYPSALDNFMKCQLSLHGVGHYMDDYYVLVPPDRDPKEILQEIGKQAESIGLTLNYAKTHIFKFGQPFKYCKSKFQVFPSGKVIHQCNRMSFVKAYRNLKKFKIKIQNCEMTYTRLYQYTNSIFAYMDNYNSFRRKRQLIQRFKELFHFSPFYYFIFKMLDSKKRDVCNP